MLAVDRDADAASRTAAKVASAGGTALAAVADVTDGEGLAAVVAACCALWGTVDILVNNVGIARLGGIADGALADWDAQIETNLRGPYLAIRAVLPVMLAQRRGAIVNVSTVASIRVPHAPLPGYGASKAGLNQLTRAVALRHARDGIRANAVLPGLIDTPMVRAQLMAHYRTEAELVAARDAQSPTGRMGRPEDVAEAVAFLASDRAAYINGVLLPVDGGSTAMMA